MQEPKVTTTQNGAPHAEKRKGEPYLDNKSQHSKKRLAQPQQPLDGSDNNNQDSCRIVCLFYKYVDVPDVDAELSNHQGEPVTGVICRTLMSYEPCLSFFQMWYCMNTASQPAPCCSWCV